MFRKKGAEPLEKPKKSKLRDWTEALVVAAILALIIRTFVVQAFKIPSGSMEDTLLIGDHLLVSKFVYGMQVPFTDDRIFKIREPQRGDVIVFEYPGPMGAGYATSFFGGRPDFIKRVIGVPGDTVEIRRKTVYVNGEPFHIPQEVFKSGVVIDACSEIGSNDKEAYGTVRDCMKPTKVPEGHYFALGDNRDNSRDSRFWGFVPEQNIKGMAFIKYWSWDRQEFRPRWGRIGRMID